MALRVQIDHREGHLKESIDTGRLACPVEFVNLELGDIIVHYKDMPIFVFERKTIADLKASIYDGRYRNQKLRMLEIHDHSTIYYIIEGDVRLNDKAVTGAIINTLLRDKIGIFRTADVQDTLQLLYDIVHRVNEDPEKYISTAQQPAQPSAPNRKESFFVNMLCQIPQISLKTAKAIHAKYTCFHDLHAIFDGRPNNERIKSLQAIVICDKHGKSRKISLPACVNIIKGYYGANHTI